MCVCARVCVYVHMIKAQMSDLNLYIYYKDLYVCIYVCIYIYIYCGVIGAMCFSDSLCMSLFVCLPACACVFVGVCERIRAPIGAKLRQRAR